MICLNDKQKSFWINENDIVGISNKAAYQKRDGPRKLGFIIRGLATTLTVCVDESTVPGIMQRVEEEAKRQRLGIST